ncbi:unnamed protein product [marine sediment metagenome]|uniref:AdoMet activation domain-containing protein n=1 Tax=marine sediment metagenome TaxID=412755 RepID=X1UMG5_9ZZZZ
MQTEPKLYRYSFRDLPLKPGWLEILMGYSEGGAPDPIPDIMAGIFAEAPGHTNIQGGIIVLDTLEFLDRSSIIVDGLDFNSGRIITGSLRNSEKIAFFLLTAGVGIETWSREMNRNGDPMSGYIIDLLGSEIVECAMDLMQAELEVEMEDMGLHISNRYSPGHCGWHVNEQKKLFSLFPENYCGISLTESSLMIPIKSVSGIIGIGGKVKKMGHLCQVCDVEKCLYRDRKHLLV